MDSLLEPQFRIKAATSPSKILQNLKKVQFIMEFFVLSRYSENSNVIAEFLMGIEAIKFYYKAAHFSQQENLYMENNESSHQILKEEKLSEKTLERTNQLLEKIRNKAYRCNNYQPHEYEQLANGKKIQLITSTKVPEDLKRCKLNFRALLGQILNILRPLVSIIGIRLFGLNSFKSYFLSLAIDLFVMIVLQRHIKVCKASQVQQMEGRKGEFLRRYFFRRPLFLVIKRVVIEPLLRMIMKEDRAVYKIVMSVLEMQSSITLTL